MKKGIDVSVNQGNINWDEVKGQVDFVILKSSYGREMSQIADNFERNYAEAKRVGIPVGVYHYCYATTVEEAKQEAQVCLKAIEGKQLEYPVWFDVEEAKTFGTGKDNVSAIINAFCAELENKGYFCGIYMSKSQLLSYVNEDTRNRYAVWVAQYYSECTYPGEFGMWQYSSEGSVNGIPAHSDMDYCYVDYPSMIINGGLNGFPKPEAKPEVKPEPIIVETPEILEPIVDNAPQMSPIKKGDTGFKVRALQELLNSYGFVFYVSGNFDDLTCDAVTIYQTKNGLEANGICDENTWLSLLK